MDPEAPVVYYLGEPMLGQPLLTLSYLQTRGQDEAGVPIGAVEQVWNPATTVTAVKFMEPAEPEGWWARTRGWLHDRWTALMDWFRASGTP
jgi:hypothetical protein